MQFGSLAIGNVVSRRHVKCNHPLSSCGHTLGRVGNQSCCENGAQFINMQRRSSRKRERRREASEAKLFERKKGGEKNEEESKRKKEREREKLCAEKMGTMTI